MTAPDGSWLTEAFVRQEHGSLHSIRMNLGALLCHAMQNGAGRGLEVGDVATLREVLDILDRLYALENALSPSWRSER